MIILKWSHISSCHPAFLKILNLGMTVWSLSYFHLSNCLELPLQSHLQEGGSVTPYSRDNVWNAQSSLWSSLALASPDLLSQGPFFCPWLAALILYHFCYSSPSTFIYFLPAPHFLSLPLLSLQELSHLYCTEQGSAISGCSFFTQSQGPFWHIQDLYWFSANLKWPSTILVKFYG